MSSEKEFEQDYPGVAKESNVDEIAGNLQQKTDRASILAKLREKKAESNQTSANSQRRKRENPER